MNPLSESVTEDLTQNFKEGSKVDYLLDYAVIGAGVSGLTVASSLNKQGLKVAVFEKARGTGGRVSSKRIASADKDSFMAFDLGCISIKAESDLFDRALQDLHQRGVIAPWFEDEKNDTHYVGMPRNSGLTRHLSKDLECHFSTRVTSIERLGDVWSVYTLEDGDKTVLAKAKNIILATPPAQAYDLLPEDSSLKSKLAEVEVDPQWVMGIEVESVPSDFKAIHYPDSDVIYSISQESLKPGRDHGQARNNADEADTSVLQIQATPRWTHNHLALSSDQVSTLLAAELERIFGQPLNIKNNYSHRWLYSCVSKGAQTKDGFLWDEKGLGLVGDYLDNSLVSKDVQGIESAWLSGKLLADWLIEKEAAELSF